MMQRFHHALLFVVGIACLWMTLPPCRGQVLTNWSAERFQHLAGPERILTSVAFGNGIFVAVGWNRTILVSSDGTNWVERSERLEISTIGINFTAEHYTIGTESLTLVIPNDGSDKAEMHRNPFQFRAVGFAKGKFVIVCENGEIYVSSTGDKWRQASTPTSANLNGIVCGEDGRLVVVGDGGTILSSADALNWQLQKSDSTQQLLGVAYGNGTFVAVGGDGYASVIVTSTDAAIWTQIPTIYHCPIGSIAFGNGKFMVSAFNDYRRKTDCGAYFSLLMVSTDGKTWRNIESPSSRVLAVFHGRDRFIELEAEWQPRSSIDGHNWLPSSREIKHGFDLYGGTYANGIYVAVGRGALGVSTDGINWKKVYPPPSKLMCGDLTRTNLLWPEYTRYATEFPLGPRSLRSRDGQTWVSFGGQPESGNVGGHQTRFLDRKRRNTFLVVHTEDGITWNTFQPPTGSHLAKPVLPIAPPASAPEEVSGASIELELNGHGYQLNSPDKKNQIYQLQASIDLEHWETIMMLTNSGTSLRFADPEIEKYPQRFYRLKPQP